jgi:hypothetical protein
MPSRAPREDNRSARRFKNRLVSWMDCGGSRVGTWMRSRLVSRMRSRLVSRVGGSRMRSRLVSRVGTRMSTVLGARPSARWTRRKGGRSITRVVSRMRTRMGNGKFIILSARPSARRSRRMCGRGKSGSGTFTRRNGSRMVTWAGARPSAR